ncbi:MAG: hypothetical protein E6J34_02570 [Chloroflexi bacterium]|nr:MAG: hypothetical protein E6J34_02570 [Chloroflexota bacterium]
MIDTRTRVLSLAEKTSEQFSSLFDRIFAAAHSESVYSKPVISGNYTVITASEVTSGGGFGSGGGIGPELPLSIIKKRPDEAASHAEQVNSGGGGGIGGGGGSAGRPVAVIIIGPEGVTVKPVLDVTKIALAGIATGIVMLTTLRKMRKMSKG